MSIITIYIITIVKKKQKNISKDEAEQVDTYMAEGMAIGMSLGSAVGILLGKDYLAIGISIGMMLGMVLGMNFKRKGEN